MSKRGRTSYLQDKSETLALMGKRRRRYADKLKSDPASQNRSSITPLLTYLSVQMSLLTIVLAESVKSAISHAYTLPPSVKRIASLRR
ncbi:hypothetical protein BgiMline_007742 [Biomphalaria glabrata]|nr:hypothetical protein BgiMline_018434 [Biomphalaria glabrata]KAI8788408.1 hypothetical protein BgiBS90_011076 [Biomphalaria glabrata]